MKRATSAVLFTSVLVDMIGFGIVIPVLPFYATSFGASPFQVTLLFAAFSAMQMVATPLWGRISDKSGRRPLLIAGLVASAVSHLIFGLSNTLWLLFASRLAAGAAAGLGFMVGPAIGGIASRWGLGFPGYVAATVAAINAVLAFFLLPESRSREDSRRTGRTETDTLAGWLAAMARFPISLMMVVYFLAISSFSGLTAVLALFLEARFAVNAQDIGFVFTIAGGATVVVRGLFLGRLVRRYGEKTVVRIGAFALLVSLAAMPLIPNAWWSGPMVILYAFGAGTLFPTLATLVSFAANRESQGAILGGSQFVGGLGRVTGPIWFGLLFQSVRPGSPFVVGAVLVAASWLMASRIPASLRPRRPGTSSPITEAVESQTLAPE